MHACMQENMYIFVYTHTHLLDSVHREPVRKRGLGLSGSWDAVLKDASGVP